MAKQRKRVVVNPLLKDRVDAIVVPLDAESADQADRQPSANPARASTEPPPKRNATPSKAREGRATVQLKARFSRESAEEIERFTRTLSSYLNTTVKGAEITRALWSLAIRSSDNLADLSTKQPDLDRPSNGDRLAMAEFEDAIAIYLLYALKSVR